jgi:hypothetical protein
MERDAKAFRRAAAARASLGEAPPVSAPRIVGPGRDPSAVVGNAESFARTGIHARALRREGQARFRSL